MFHTFVQVFRNGCSFLTGICTGIVVTDEVRNYALSQGLYFIEYAGETFYITAPKDEPREW